MIFSSIGSFLFSFVATREELASTLLSYSEALKDSSVAGKQERAPEIKQHLSGDAKMLMRKLINHGKAIANTYRKIYRCYSHRCNLVIEEFDKLILSLNCIDYLSWNAWEILEMLSYLVGRLVPSWNRNDDLVASGVHDTAYSIMYH
jgi:hypothetical protein